MRLSKDFTLSEFLRSGLMPGVADYVPTAAELARLKSLVTAVLQPLRDKFGPLRITSGARPYAVRTPDGRTFAEALKAAGYSPAQHSDHALFVAADFRPAALALGDWPKVFDALRRNLSVRQVIVAYKRVGGDFLADHIHVAVISPGLPRFQAPDFAFSKIDGKRAGEGAIHAA